MRVEGPQISPAVNARVLAFDIDYYVASGQTIRIFKTRTYYSVFFRYNTYTVWL